MAEPSSGASLPGQPLTGEREELETRLLLERTPVILWTVDRELRFTSGAGSGLTPLGFSQDQMIGVSLFELFRTDDTRFPAIAAHLRALEGETLDYDDEWEGRFYQSHVEPLRDPRGHITGCVGISLDVTERQRLEREQARLLAEARVARVIAEDARWRSAFLAEAGRLLWGSLDYEVTLQRVVHLAVPQLVDACAVAMLGEGGMLRQAAIALRNPAQESKAVDLWRHSPWSANGPEGIRKVMRTGRPELYPDLPDPLLAAAARSPEYLRFLRMLELSSALHVPLIAHGQTLGVLTLATSRSSGRRLTGADVPLAEDLAGRCALALDNARLYREAQEAIRRRDESLAQLNASIRVRDDFLSIASHELKTPLTPLSLRLQALEKALENEAPVEIEQVRKARKHLDMLTSLINDLLDVSRIQSGRLVLHPEPTPLRPLLREVVASFRPVSPKHQLLLDEPGEEVVVRADRSRLEQVLQNLVENAIKYSPAGGRVRVALSAGEAEALLSVSDEGIGIPREQQPRLFQRYFRAQNVSTRSYGGLGLGLYICRDIVERHGGQIRVESEEGRGSTFFVTLPRVKAEAGGRPGAGAPVGV